MGCVRPFTEETWFSAARTGSVTGLSLDSDVLISLDRNERRFVLLLDKVLASGFRITIPTTALAQAMRNPARQARLSRLIREPLTDLMDLDEADAIAVGKLLARSATSDIVDAHVVVCARKRGQPVVISDPDDLRRLAPELDLIVL